MFIIIKKFSEKKKSKLKMAYKSLSFYTVEKNKEIQHESFL